jgi:hypothetical protein
MISAVDIARSSGDYRSVRWMMSRPYHEINNGAAVHAPNALPRVGVRPGGSWLLEDRIEDPGFKIQEFQATDTEGLRSDLNLEFVIWNRFFPALSTIGDGLDIG